MTLLVEGTKIIAYGIIDYKQYGELPDGQILIVDYKKPWPVDASGNPLPKNLCYWDQLGQEVFPKTQTMLQDEITEKIDKEIKEICIMLNKVICDCATYEEFKTKIETLGVLNE